jgi:hypothetical protein
MTYWYTKDRNQFHHLNTHILSRGPTFQHASLYIADFSFRGLNRIELEDARRARWCPETMKKRKLFARQILEEERGSN